MTSRFHDDDPVIAQGEAWLREQMDELPALDLERIKRRVHLELNERWLAGQLDEGGFERVRPRLHAAIRRELNARLRSHDAAAAEQRPAPPLRRWTFWGTGASAAVAACLALMVARTTTTSVQSSPVSALDAFARYESDGLMLELAALRSRVNEFSSGSSSERNEEVTRGLTDLRESIDRIFETNDTADDWS